MAMLEQLTCFDAVPVVQSDTTVVDLIGLVISATGTVKFDNGVGDTVTFVVPAAVTDETVTALPFILWGRITKIHATTTDIADANLTGLKKF